tara:strand:- start:9578 stop:10825 length:1248 start_codon:yes stop_codon:yes gene_type:complete
MSDFSSYLKKGLMIVFAEKALLLGLSFFSNIFLARLLGVAEFGGIAFLFSLFSMFVQISDFGFRNIFVDVYSKGNRSVVALYFYVRGFLSFLIGLVGLLAYYCFDLDIGYVVICAILIFYVADVLEAVAISEMRQSYAAMVRLINGVIMHLSRIVMVVLDVDPLYLLLTLLCEPFLKFFFLIHWVDLSSPRLSLLEVISLLKRAFPLFLSMIFLQVFIRSLYFIAQDFSTDDAGYVAAVMRLIDPFLMLLGVLSVVINPIMAKVENFGSFCKIYYSVVFYVGVVFSSIVYLSADFLVDLIYGDQYAAAAELLSIVALSLPFLFLGGVSGFWYVRNRVEYMALIRGGGALVGTFFGYYFWKEDGIESIAWGWVLSSIFYAFIVDLIVPKGRQLFYIKMAAFFEIFYMIGRAVREKN